MRLCLAGTYAFQDIMKGKAPKYVLESFWYIKDWQIPLIKECDLFLLDSGAFTYMNSARKGKKITIQDFYDYLDKYIEFINKYDIKHFFELDVDVILGYDEVKNMRRILEQRTGKKCIPVFHKNRGIQEWYKMVKEYDYVAIGASGKNDSLWTRQHPEVVEKMLQIARQHNCKVHGLGYTKKDKLMLQFYSTDSTSWSSGWRYGLLYKFKENTIKQIKKDANKRVKVEKGYDVQGHNLSEWIKYQEYLSRR